MNELIKYEQPTYDFSKVDEKVKEVTQELSKYNFDELVITEDNKSEIKKVRTKFGKEFKEFEDFRKQFKKNVMIPYDEFEKVYKPLADLYKKADSDLKNGVDEIENKQKEEVVEQVTTEFEELKSTHGLDFLKLDQSGLSVKLSDSAKSRTEFITTFVERVKADVDTINTLKTKERVQVVYESNGLNLANAITTVNNAIEREEEMKNVAEEKGEVNTSTITEVVKNEPKINMVAEEFEMTFKVLAPKHTLTELKEYMVANHIKFEGVR